jgi:hypothetical protein
MAVSELGGVQELESWQRDEQRPAYVRYATALWHFAKRKPLGAVCGFVVIFFVLVGDLVPETVNKVSRTAGISDRPVPYLRTSWKRTPVSSIPMPSKTCALAFKGRAASTCWAPTLSAATS